jgi:hypothetical protein
VALSKFKVVKIFGAASGQDADLLNGDWLHLGPSTTLTLNATTPGEVQMTLAYYFDRQVQLLTVVA